MRKLNPSPSNQKLSDLTVSSRKTRTRLYDLLEKEVTRLTVLTSLLTITLVLSTVMLVIAVIIIASFRTEHFLLELQPASRIFSSAADELND